MDSSEVRKKNYKNFQPLGLSIDTNISLDMSGIDLSDTFDSLQGMSGSNKKFLNRFSEKDLFAVMAKTGLTEHLGNKGFEKIIINTDKDENGINYLKLFWNEKTPENQLIDLRVSESSFVPDKKFFAKGEEVLSYDMIVIEWLSAKNPLAIFDGTRPQLPGQTNPGLGVLTYCFDMLYLMAKQIYKDGFLDIPDHMHNAIMYSKKFKFFDPVHEAIIRAAIRDMKKYSLADISWGVLTNTIIDVNKDEPQIYDPCEQIHYVSKRMKNYFKSRKYTSAFKNFYNKKKFYFDYEEMLKRRDVLLKTKRIEEL